MVMPTTAMMMRMFLSVMMRTVFVLFFIVMMPTAVIVLFFIVMMTAAVFVLFFTVMMVMMIMMMRRFLPYFLEQCLFQILFLSDNF